MKKHGTPAPHQGPQPKVLVPGKEAPTHLVVKNSENSDHPGGMEGCGHSPWGLAEAQLLRGCQKQGERWNCVTSGRGLEEELTFSLY